MQGSQRRCYGISVSKPRSLLLLRSPWPGVTSGSNSCCMSVRKKASCQSRRLHRTRAFGTCMYACMCASTRTHARTCSAVLEIVDAAGQPQQHYLKRSFMVKNLIDELDRSHQAEVDRPASPTPPPQAKGSDNVQQTIPRVLSCKSSSPRKATSHSSHNRTSTAPPDLPALPDLQPFGTTDDDLLCPPPHTSKPRTSGGVVRSHHSALPRSPVNKSLVQRLRETQEVTARQIERGLCGTISCLSSKS